MEKNFYSNRTGWADASSVPGGQGISTGKTPFPSGSHGRVPGRVSRGACPGGSSEAGHPCGLLFCLLPLQSDTLSRSDKSHRVSWDKEVGRPKAIVRVGLSVLKN